MPPLGASLRHAAHWPLRDCLDLDARPEAVPYARRHARHVLAGWRLGLAVGDTELIVSELVSNGVAASASANPPGPAAGG